MMASSSFAEVTDKEISEIKINSVPKNTKDLCKNTKTIILLRLGDYGGIFTLIRTSWLDTQIIYIWQKVASFRPVLCLVTLHNDNDTITCIRTLIGQKFIVIVVLKKNRLGERF
jgi:hypothetical protein